MTALQTVPATHVATHYVGDGAFEIRHDPVPAAATTGEALIAVEAAGICGTDLHVTNPAAAYEYENEILGHEYCGRIVDGPSELIGRKVVVDPLIACGVCESCRRGLMTQCSDVDWIGTQRPGGFAEYAVAPVDRLVAVPEVLDAATAALAEPLACVLYALSRVPALEPAGRAVVLGGGPIGMLFATVLERAMGREVVVVEPGQIRASHIAARLQADVVAPGSISQEFGAELVVDATGFLFAQAVELARPGGVILLFGLEDRGGPSAQVGLVRKELTVVSACGAWGTFGKAVELLHRGIVTGADLITATFGFDEIAQGFDVARDGGALKVVLRP